MKRLWILGLMVLVLITVAANPTPTPAPLCPGQITATAVAQTPQTFNLWDWNIEEWVSSSDWFSQTPQPTIVPTSSPTLTPTTSPAWPTPDLPSPWNTFHPAWLFGAEYYRAPRNQTYWEALAFHVDCLFNNGQHTIFVKVTADYGDTQNFKVCFTWEGNVNPPICRYPDKDEWIGLDFPMYGARYEVWIYDFPYTSDRVKGLTSSPEFPDPEVYPVENPVTGWGYPGCTSGHNSWAIWFRLHRVGVPTLTPTATNTAQPTPTSTATTGPTPVVTVTATPVDELMIMLNQLYARDPVLFHIIYDLVDEILEESP